MLATVLVVAGTVSAQRGLAAMVESDGDFTVAGRLSWADTERPDYSVLLGEIRPGEQVRDLQEPFVLLSDPRGFSAGPGRAYLSREADDPTVLCALRAVLLGLSVTDATHHAADYAPESDLLTPRELEVLTLLGEGYSNRQIAETLAISENTVKFHLSSLFSKLDVGSRGEAVSAGLRSGLLLM